MPAMPRRRATGATLTPLPLLQVLAERVALFEKLRERMPLLKQKVAGSTGLEPSR